MHIPLNTLQYFGSSDQLLACGGAVGGGHVASHQQLRQMVVQQDLLSGQPGSGAVVAK